MNEQLDKIADQVMYEFKDAFSCSNECGSIPDEFFVRFAELIAQLEESPNSTKTLVESEKREWVGLTDKEIIQLSKVHGTGFIPDNYLARAIEAKLKEKNT
jgi:hypothetical protein